MEKLRKALNGVLNVLAGGSMAVMVILTCLLYTSPSPRD